MLNKLLLIFESNLFKILIDISEKKLIKHGLFIYVRENSHAYKEYDVLLPQLELSSDQKQLGFSFFKMK